MSEHRAKRDAIIRARRLKMINSLMIGLIFAMMAYIILFDSSGIGFSTPLLYLLGAGLSVLSLLLLLRSKREAKPAFAPRRRRD